MNGGAGQATSSGPVVTGSGGVFGGGSVATVTAMPPVQVATGLPVPTQSGAGRTVQVSKSLYSIWLSMLMLALLRSVLWRYILRSWCLLSRKSGDEEVMIFDTQWRVQ